MYIKILNEKLRPEYIPDLTVPEVESFIKFLVSDHEKLLDSGTFGVVCSIDPYTDFYVSGGLKLNLVSDMETIIKKTENTELKNYCIKVCDAVVKTSETSVVQFVSE